MTRKPLTAQERADALIAAYHEHLQTPAAERDGKALANDLGYALDLAKDLLRQNQEQREALDAADQMFAAADKAKLAIARVRP